MIPDRELDENGECWLGKPCPTCGGHGVDNENHRCPDCAGTGEAYGKPE